MKDKHPQKRETLTSESAITNYLSKLVDSFNKGKVKSINQFKTVKK